MASKKFRLQEMIQQATTKTLHKWIQDMFYLVCLSLVLWTKLSGKPVFLYIFLKIPPRNKKPLWQETIKQIPFLLVLQQSFATATPKMNACFANEVWETASNKLYHLVCLPRQNHGKI